MVFIHSSSGGLIVLTSLGMKLDIIFDMVSFRILTWRLGLWFLKLISHAYLNTATFREFSLARSKCQNFLKYLGGGGILELILQNTIVCQTVTSSKSRAPLSKTNFGWSVTIKSIYEGSYVSHKRNVWAQISFGSNLNRRTNYLGQHPHDSCPGLHTTFESVQ